jgi:heme ABC exporter ATP-binding subunit CcmA
MIRARGLAKSYAGAVVLEPLSLDVAAGSVLAVLGPNGAGKTTLLRLLATLLRPSRGSLELGGLDALREPERVRPWLAMIGHGTQLYEELSALENLRFWAVLGGGPRETATLRAVLGRVELDGVAEERVRTFSAGMRRRLALARLLLGAPRLVLLDEPFSGLDRQGRKWLGQLLAELRQAGATVVLATHALGPEVAVADRIAIVAAGRLVLDRPLAELAWEEIPALYDTLTEGRT